MNLAVGAPSHFPIPRTLPPSPTDAVDRAAVRTAFEWRR